MRALKLFWEFLLIISVIGFFIGPFSLIFGAIWVVKGIKLNRELDMKAKK